MIRFTQQGDEIILQMSIDDWERLLWIVQIAARAALARDDNEQFWGFMKFANEMNRNNPAFTPHEIPEDFR